MPNTVASSQDLAGVKTTADSANSVAASAATAAATAQTTANNAQTTANNAIPLSQKGAASGVAPLDGSSRVPAANLPVSVGIAGQTIAVSNNGLPSGQIAITAISSAGAVLIYNVLYTDNYVGLESGIRAFTPGAITTGGASNVVTNPGTYQVIFTMSGNTLQVEYTGPNMSGIATATVNWIIMNPG